MGAEGSLAAQVPQKKTRGSLKWWSVHSEYVGGGEGGVGSRH